MNVGYSAAGCGEIRVNLCPNLVLLPLYLARLVLQNMLVKLINNNNKNLLNTPLDAL